MKWMCLIFSLSFVHRFMYCISLEEYANHDEHLSYEAQQSKKDDSAELSSNQNNESEKDESTELSRNQDNGSENDSSFEFKIIQNSNNNNKQTSQVLDKEQYETEKLAGDPADTFGNTEHHYYPPNFNNFGRRFILQYPYVKKDEVDAESGLVKSIKKVKKQSNLDEEDLKLLPVKAPPELVLSVALRSVLDEVDQPQNLDSNKKDILRTGDYWDSFWKEDADPKRVLRSFQKKIGYKLKNTFPNHTPKLNSLKTKIMPGSKLYQLVSVLKEASPRLLYVINDPNKR